MKALRSVYPEYQWLPWKFVHLSATPRTQHSLPWAEERDNHRLYMDWLLASRYQRLNQPQQLRPISSNIDLDEWYSIKHTMELFSIHPPSRYFLTKYYGGSLYRALVSLYPHHNWQLWKFSDGTRTIDDWKDMNVQRQHFDWLQQELIVGRPGDGGGEYDWYSVRLEDIQQRGGKELMAHYYGNDLYSALKTIYPNKSWTASKFIDRKNITSHNQPPTTTTSSNNSNSNIINTTTQPIPEQVQKELFHALALQIGIEKPEDWYRIKLTNIQHKPLKKIISNYYGGSVIKAINTLFPEYQLKSSSVLQHIDNHRRYFEDLYNKLFPDSSTSQLSSPSTSSSPSLDKWYNVNLMDIHRQHPSGKDKLLLYYYDGSLYQALSTIYPHHHPSWNPKRFWQDNSNNNNNSYHVQFFDWLSPLLNIQSLEDWYRIKPSQVNKYGGRELLQHYYHNSLALALQSLYPHHNWRPWKFYEWQSHSSTNNSMVSSSYWEYRENTIVYLEWLAKELNIQRRSDWDEVNTADIVNRDGKGLLQKYGGSIKNVLKEIYSQFNWPTKPSLTKQQVVSILYPINHSFLLSIHHGINSS